MKNSREFMDDKGIFYRSYRQAEAVLRENPEVTNFECFDVCLEVEYSLLGLGETEAVCWCRHSQLSTEHCRVEAGGRWDLFLGRLQSSFSTLKHQTAGRGKPAAGSGQWTDADYFPAGWKRTKV